MKIELNGKNYKVIKNYRDGFEEEPVVEKTTDYFIDFDYILGDWAYGKLRLKGFYKNTNKKVKEMNNYDNIDKYIEENCAFDCKYFILEKID